MKFQFEVDVDIDELMDAIIAKMPAGGATVAAEEEDLLGGGAEEEPEEELTAEALLEKITAEVKRLGKDAVLATVKKIANVTKAGAIPEDKRKAVLDALAKQKPAKK